MTARGVRSPEPIRVTLAKYGGFGSMVMLCGLAGVLHGLTALLLSVVLVFASSICSIGIFADLYGDTIKGSQKSSAPAPRSYRLPRAEFDAILDGGPGDEDDESAAFQPDNEMGAEGYR